MDTRGKLKTCLKQFECESTLSQLPPHQKASVLIPLFMKKGELHILMTLRSLNLKHSAGEVCFPGGKHDSRDRDEIDTALREAEEEIGLSTDQVEVVGRLFPVLSKSGLFVTPVVAFIKDTFQAHPNPEEVSHVFSVPLSFFLGQTNHSSYYLPGITGKLHSFMYQDFDSKKTFHIWGLTAILAILVAVLVLGRKPMFEVDFDSEDPLPFFQRNLHFQISKL
ncbi:peroxisomal coenzyme A diphosphatase NUDT7 [Paramormyrops kingsleyae]|uniref:Peroxisomal coenzyme A diphosphatase NUDT7 n=1 Tax=Paramormyrops kingsleyae TaxID=1676925 RepID=A0A3B3R9H1_9TELE|nr:peroxisomal coenzyme A diphosphatase NUDT7 [Paramormyrops kingsleyae]